MGALQEGNGSGEEDISVRARHDSSKGGIQSQTAESIGLVEEMGLPVVVAITKLDLLHSLVAPVALHTAGT